MLANKIEQIVANLYPDANFILSSEFEADYESYFKDENVLIVLNNQLDVDDTIGENVNFQSREKIQLSIYIKDESGTLNATSNELVEQAKEISRKIYLNIWLLPEVNGEKSDKRVTHRPFIKQFNSIRSGVLSLANWVTTQKISCIPVGKFRLTLNSNDETQGLVTSNPDKVIFTDGESATIAAAPLSGFVFDRWDVNGQEFTEQSLELFFDEDEDKDAVAYFQIIIQTFNRLITTFQNLTKIINDYSFDGVYDLTQQDLSGYDALRIRMLGQSNINKEIEVNLDDIPSYLHDFLNMVGIKSPNDPVYYSLQDKIGRPQPLRTSQWSIALHVAMVTGKFVYIDHWAVGGTGFSTSPSWKYGEVGGYLEDFIDSYNEGTLLITESYKLIGTIYSQWEADSLLKVNTDLWITEFPKLVNGLETETGESSPWVVFAPHVYSAGFSVFGWEIYDKMKEMLYNKNSADYIPNSWLQHVNQFNEDGAHFSTPVGQYAEMYKNTAYLLLNQPISDDRINVLNTPSLSLTTPITTDNTNYNSGAKSVWIKMNLTQDADLRNIYANIITTTGGIRARITSNSIAIQWRVYGSTGQIIDVDSVGTEFGVRSVYGFTWDGTTDANSARGFYHSYNDRDLIVDRFATPTGLEDNAPTNPVLSIGNKNMELFSLYELDRKLTDEEIQLIIADRDEEISGVIATYFDAGNGDKVYSQNGNEKDLSASNPSWNNEGVLPYSNLISNREIQTDGVNYRIVPQGTIASGWVKIENVDLNKWYDVFNSSIKLPQIADLVTLDTDNVFYDSNGIAKEVTGAELRAATSDYIEAILDTIGFKEIKIRQEI